MATDILAGIDVNALFSSVVTSIPAASATTWADWKFDRVGFRPEVIAAAKANGTIEQLKVEAIKREKILDSMPMTDGRKPTMISGRWATIADMLGPHDIKHDSDRKALYNHVNSHCGGLTVLQLADLVLDYGLPIDKAKVLAKNQAAVLLEKLHTHKREAAAAIVTTSKVARVANAAGPFTAATIGAGANASPCAAAAGNNIANAMDVLNQQMAVKDEACGSSSPTPPRRTVKNKAA